jgi:hypothetical protein
MSVQATGRIKQYQAIVGGVLLTAFPIAYVCYALGAGPPAALIVSVVISLIAIATRLVFMKKYLNFSKREYFAKVLLVSLLVFAVSSIPPFIVHKSLDVGIFRLIIVGATSLVSSVCVIYYLGLTVAERHGVNTIFRSRIMNKIRKM